MTAETKYHGISQFFYKNHKFTISYSKIYYKNHKNYYLKSKICYENSKNYYLIRKNLTWRVCPRAVDNCQFPYKKSKVYNKNFLRA